MKCIYCNGSLSRVIDSRPSEDGTSIRRRRECMDCFKRFTTYEKAEPVRLMVIKNDGTKQSFELKKIRRGIEKACEKRPVQKETIDGIVERIRLSVSDQYDDEVSSKEIGRMVLKELRQADQVAFARFSMIHHEINDLHGFIKELERLI